MRSAPNVVVSWTMASDDILPDWSREVDLIMMESVLRRLAGRIRCDKHPEEGMTGAADPFPITGATEAPLIVSFDVHFRCTSCACYYASTTGYGPRLEDEVGRKCKMLTHEESFLFLDADRRWCCPICDHVEAANSTD